MGEAEKERYKLIIALMAIGYTFFYIHSITFYEVPKENQRFADMILGSLLTIVLGKVLGEYFNGK